MVHRGVVHIGEHALIRESDAGLHDQSAILVLVQEMDSCRPTARRIRRRRHGVDKRGPAAVRGEADEMVRT